MQQKQSGIRVLFLDYDGVVNTLMWNEAGTKCTYNHPEDGKVNNFQAVQWVSEFCQKYKYDIVVTSTWRRFENWRECLINGGLRKGINIIGCTDIMNDKRGKEIKRYLEQHPEIKHYIIVDDEAYGILPEQKKYLVETNGSVGFGITELYKCMDVYYEEKK